MKVSFSRGEDGDPITRKQLIMMFIMFGSVYLGFYFFDKAIYINSSITCATFTYENVNKEEKYVIHYSFSINGENYDGETRSMNLNKKSLEDLKKLECVKVEYSNIAPSINRIVDMEEIK